MDKKIEEIGNTLCHSGDKKGKRKHDEDTDAFELMKKEAERLKSEYECKMAKIVQRMQAYKQLRAIGGLASDFTIKENQEKAEKNQYDPSVSWSSDEVILPDSLNSPQLPFQSKHSSIEDDIIIPQVKLEVMDSDEEETSSPDTCTSSKAIKSNLTSTISSDNQISCSAKQINLQPNGTCNKMTGASQKQKIVPIYIVSMKKKAHVIETDQMDFTNLEKESDINNFSSTSVNAQMLPVYYLSMKEPISSEHKKPENQILLPLCNARKKSTHVLQAQPNKHIKKQSKIVLPSVKDLKSVETVSSLQNCDSSSLVPPHSLPTNESALIGNHNRTRKCLPRKRKVTTSCCVGCNEDNSHRSSLSDKSLSLGKNKDIADNVPLTAVASNLNHGIKSQESCDLPPKDVLPQKLKRLLQSGNNNNNNQYLNKNGLRHLGLPAQLPKPNYPHLATKWKVAENFEVEEPSDDSESALSQLNYGKINSSSGSHVKSTKKRKMRSCEKSSTFSLASADNFSNEDFIPASQIKVEVNDEDEHQCEINNVKVSNLIAKRHPVKWKNFGPTSASNFDLIPPSKIKIEFEDEAGTIQRCASPEMILSNLNNDDSALGSSSSESQTKDPNTDEDRPKSPKSQMDLMQFQRVSEAYQSGRYNEMFHFMEFYSFNAEHHTKLQKMWNDAHYAVVQNTKSRPLGPVDRYRIRKRFPCPYTIWDGEATIYSFKTRSRLYLNQAFKLDKYPSNEMKVELALKTGLSVHQVSNWFKNKRQRGKLSESPKMEAIKGEPLSS